MNGKAQQNVIGVIGAIALAFTLIACGYAACAGIPQTTRMLAQATVEEDDSPFSTDQLVDMAAAVRAYSFGAHDLDALMEAVSVINDEAETPYAGATADELLDADVAYALDSEAIDHLDDVNALARRVTFPLIGMVALAVFCLMASMRYWGLRAVSRCLVWAGAAVLAAFAVLGIWAAASFNSLFAVFHSLFFASGSWVFPADSLLICSLPQDFWMGMAGVWLLTSALLSILALAGGLVLRRKMPSAAQVDAARTAQAESEARNEHSMDENDLKTNVSADASAAVTTDRASCAEGAIEPTGLQGAPRVRFAPSPTGKLHVGGARTAIYNWAFARATGGTFILRIEDTDPERSTQENTQVILRALRWLGLDWDEGPEVGGESGPYFQTQRGETYADALERMKARGAVYPCFCSKETLDAKRAEAEKTEGGYAGYDRTCRNLPAEEAAARIAAGEPHVWRLKVPEGHGPVEFDDAVYGHMSFPADVLDDMIVVRTDGSPTYNFAVVCDDSNMGITHVIRGDDHLSNTPRQILIYEALGLPTPTFAHLSMILGADGKKLSKRHGAASVEEFAQRGYLPDTMVNFLSLLGWSLDGETTLIDRETLCREFSLDRITKKDAVFDETKLDWMNGQYIKSMGDAAWVAASLPWIAEAKDKGKAAPPGANVFEPEEAQAAVEERMLGDVDVVSLSFDVEEDPEFFNALYPLLAERETRLVDAATKLPYMFWGENVMLDAKSVKKVLQKEGSRADEALAACRSVLADESIPWECEALQQACRAKGEELGLKPKNLFQPLRVAICGNMVSPPLFESIELMKREDTLARIDGTVEVVFGK